MALFENLSGFFNSRPPLVVFMMCLASFAITLITLAYVVKTKDLPDPDVTEDWNTMLEKFAVMQFCVPKSKFTHNNSSTAKLSAGEKSVGEAYEEIHDKVSQTLGTLGSAATDGKDHSETFVSTSRIKKREADAGLHYFKRDSTNTRKTTIESTTADRRIVSPSAHQVSAKAKENVTVNLSFIYIPRTPSDKSAVEFARFYSAITAHQLKLDVSSKVKGEESFDIFLNLPHNLSSVGVRCEEWEGKNCLQYHMPVCITFQALPHLLPQTLRPDQSQCSAYSDPSPQDYNQIQAGTLSEAAKNDWCEEGSRLVPQYTLDDSLTVFLTLHDKSRINLHLMRTSYFLFVMVVTLFCYALIKGRPPKLKSQHIVYEKVASSA